MWYPSWLHRVSKVRPPWVDKSPYSSVSTIFFEAFPGNDGKMMGKWWENAYYGELEVVQLEIRSGDFDILVATNVAPKA